MMKKFISIVLWCVGVAVFALPTKLVITSVNSVSIDDCFLSTASAMYSQTHSTKGTMTKGNSTLLRVSGLSGYLIKSISLEMHSNSSDGKGALLAKIGENEIWKIDTVGFNSLQWNGAYTSSYVEIRKEFEVFPIVSGSEDLTIQIGASSNSLYLSSYTIELVKNEPFTVRLVDESEVTSVTEEMATEGVVLPTLPNVENKKFVGWSYTPTVNTKDGVILSKVFSAGSMFHPIENTTLYAIYLESKNMKIAQAMEMKNGTYLMGQKIGNKLYLMLGKVGAYTSEVVKAVEVDYRKEGGKIILEGDYLVGNMLYDVAFLNEQKEAKITHKESDTKVSWNPTKTRATYLTTKDTTWKVAEYEDKTVAFYVDYEGESTRKLSTEGIDYRNYADATFKEDTTGLVLFLVSEEMQSKIDVKYIVATEPTGVEMVTGKDGLQLSYGEIKSENEDSICVYDIKGNLVIKGEKEVDVLNLPQGIYVAKASNRSLVFGR